MCQYVMSINIDTTVTVTAQKDLHCNALIITFADLSQFSCTTRFHHNSTIAFADLSRLSCTTQFHHNSTIAFADLSRLSCTTRFHHNSIPFTAPSPTQRVRDCILHLGFGGIWPGVVVILEVNHHSILERVRVEL